MSGIDLNKDIYRIEGVEDTARAALSEAVDSRQISSAVSTALRRQRIAD